MADYPDHTDVMQTIGSDIMLPIDLQAAYIMMPVDIQGQYVNVDIDIVAQSLGNLSIDIVAQTLEQLDINLAASAVTIDVNIESSDTTLNVNLAASDITLDVNIKTTEATLDIDITAQTLGDLDINVNAQNIGVQLNPDWQAIQGNYKGFSVSGTGLAVGGSHDYDYTVPSGKTVYVHFLYFRCSANQDADKDLNQMGSIYGANLVLGGNGGGSMMLPVPVVFTEGQDVTIGFVNRANHTLDYHAGWRGYEV